MARVKLVEKDQAAPQVQELFGKLEANGARVLNLYKAVAGAPTVTAEFMRLGNCLLTKAELPARIRELAILRIARLACSQYEWAQHVPVAKETGLSQQQIDALEEWKASAVFGDLERAVLQYVDEVAVKVEVSDETFDHLKRVLPERQVVELTIAIGYWGMIARVLVPLKVEIDKNSVGTGSDLYGRPRKNK